MGFLLILAVCIFAYGCVENKTVPHSPELDERAFQIVWEGVYGMRADQRPTLVWHDTPDCSVNDEPGITNPATHQCLWGYTWSKQVGKPIVDVFYFGSYHESGFAHELMHARKYLLSPLHDADVTHQGPEWSTLVPEAADALTF